LLISILASVCSVCAASAQSLDDLTMTVAFLEQTKKTDQKVEKVIGTAFFVDAGSPFLVTAEHVAKELTTTSSIAVRDDGDVPVKLKIGDLVSGVLQLPWTKHREGDVAVLKLSSTSRLGERKKRFFSVKQLPSQEGTPSRQMILTIMGFPLALGTSGRFSPISTEVKASSGLLRFNRFDTKTEATFYVVDKPSIGGYSGAPVFLAPQPAYTSAGKFTIPGANNPTLMVGLVHGTISDSTGGKLWAIVPPSIIFEVISAASGSMVSE